jgi:hypothetical protein
MRTEALEIEAKALNAEKDLLAELSKDSSSLDFETISGNLREHFSSLCDAPMFRAGTYHTEERRLDYRLVMENGERPPAFTIDTTKCNRMEVWCIENAKPVLISDAAQQTGQYIGTDSADADGSLLLRAVCDAAEVGGGAPLADAQGSA